jgi:hypothetical protein
MHSADLNKLGLDAVDVPGIDVLDQRAGKTVFHAEQNAYLLHHALPSRESGGPRTVGYTATVYGKQQVEPACGE